ncbi:MAG TPA: transketolase C-terminal domain-containing protein [Verrucomicrobiae bacterium]|nr:transketolase C-terminal domain-containing protein [Verrucomicrobiae bacterium]
MRKAFSETLLKVAESDPNLVFVTGDLGFQVFDEYQRRFGPRYVNAGVAEAQMVSFAAGLAAEGHRAIAYSIASFATARPFEQIRYCVAYPSLPVTLVGAGRGFTYATSGVSHHATDDIALMSALPNMTVVIPGDPTELEQLLPQVTRLPGPSYFTVGRFGEPRFEAEEPAVLGRARLLRRGERVAIVTTGEIANEVLKAVEWLRAEQINPVVYQFHTVKPLDTVVLNQLAVAADAILVVDEHLPMGGLWSAITNWMATLERPVRLARLGPPDRFALGNLRREELRRKLGYDAAAIRETCRRLWQTHARN